MRHYRITDTIHVYFDCLVEGDDKRKREELSKQKMLREIFGEEVRWAYGENGSPYLVDRQEYVSISHSKDYLCIAVSKFEPVGVDVEQVQPRIDKLKSKFMTDNELQQLPHPSLQNLTVCWSAKEAVYKIAGNMAGAYGERITLCMDDIEESRFSAMIGIQNQYLARVLERNDEYVIVLATRNRTVYESINYKRFAGRKILTVLLDPEKTPLTDLPSLAIKMNEGGIDFVFVGGSSGSALLDTFVDELKRYVPEIPVVLFPGNLMQITHKADALLFLSVISGRNPEMLIGRQVEAAKILDEEQIDIIPMGYILVDGGRKSAVERASGTTAIPQTNVEEIVSTAVAGKLLGMQLIYLEAGSGALSPVSPLLVQQVKSRINVPLIVGGGICSVEQMHSAFAAGADMVVVGNHFEQHPEDIVLFGKAREN